MKTRIYKILFILLLLTALVLLVLIINKYINRSIDEKENQQVIDDFLNAPIAEEGEEPQKLEMRGYEVIGIVTIPKIDIQYPILALETSNPEETKEPMKFAIVKYWGGNVNEYGNLSIAGHNNHDGTMFGKTKNLEIGDVVELTDMKKHKVSYQIYDKFKTDPNDVSVLKTTDTSIREVTLITCTNGNKERLILKAREIN